MSNTSKHELVVALSAANNMIKMLGSPLFNKQEGLLRASRAVSEMVDYLLIEEGKTNNEST